MTDPTDYARNVATVQRFLDAFNNGWPTEEDLDELVAPDVRLIDRPNLVNPTGSDRDAATMRAGMQAGRALLAWQRYDVRDHLAFDDTVVTRMRWSGELAVDAGAWTKGTKLSVVRRPLPAARRQHRRDRAPRLLRRARTADRLTAT